MSEENKLEGVKFSFDGFEEQLLKHVRNNGGTAGIGGQGFIKELVRRTYQALLNAEMEEHLGYEKHAPDGKGRDNTRNGHGQKTVRGDFGQVEIETPRDRKGTFSPVIIKKRESSVGDFTEKIISLYARGMTTREIEEHLKEMYQIDISPTFISRATDTVQREIIDWQNRPLEKLYVILYVDGIRFSVRSSDNGPIRKKVFYTVLGVNASGRQDVLGLWIADSEGASFWLKVLNEIKARGVEDILIACVDGLVGLPDVFETVFPNTDVQLCIVHQIRNATKFVAYKDRKQFCADMKPIYHASSEAAAKAALDDLEAKWGAKYPMSVKSWRDNWERLITFIQYPVELRKIIYTTNSVERLHDLLRKNTSNRRVFPNDDALLKLLYLNIKNFSKKWTKRQGWDIVMNQLSILFPDRLASVVEVEI